MWETMYYAPQVRPIEIVTIDPDLIQSGDMFGTGGINAMSSLIMYGPGSRLAHSLMALRFDGELYILESTDPYIKRTPWA